VTEQGQDRKVKPDGRLPRSRSGWLDRGVSWKVLISTVAIGILAVAIFVVAGGVNVSADRPDGWLSRNLLHFVFKRNVSARSASVIPPDDLAAPSRVRLAAQHFDMVCANCHGRPGFGQSVVALSLSPRPQYLPKVVGQFTNSELYVIVEHGVKYSAMPSWPTDARGDEVWSMVAFLRRLPLLDAKAYRDLTALPAPGAAAPAGSGDDASLHPANARRDTPPIDEFLYAAPAAGFSDQAIHEAPEATCARCHGADGSGAATGGEAPNLTIQDPAYLRAALTAYTRGSRKSGFMQNIAAQLSDAQIAALSTYYAGLPVKTAASTAADPALVKRGATIAAEGIRERAIPACSNCHESEGAKINGAPRIAGQSATFLRRQLGAMGRGGRGATVPWNPMPAVAHDLDKNDIAAVAAYYSGLTPARAAGGDRPAQGLQSTRLPSETGWAAGAAKAIFETRCMKCHVNGGRGDPQGNYPNLTIQGSSYVAQSLYEFRTAARPGVKMREVTDSLTFDQLKSLANYVNGLSPQRALAKPDADAASRGAAIAMRGVPARGVPACLSCHDANGVAALPLIPRLQGQNALYLRNKLNNFAKPYNVNLSALNPMPSIAGQLTDRERADLAAYFAAAAPLEKPEARR
jgi:cytochrome c553